MKKRALITGVTGQDGAYLSKFLLDKGYDVYGFVGRRVNQSFYNLNYLGTKDKIIFSHGDLTDSQSIINVIKDVRPNEIYNLAAMSFVGFSWNEPIYTQNVNGMGPLYILEAIKNFSPNTKLYQASTSEMYGNSFEKDFTQNENTRFKPRSPYAVSKLFAHELVNNYRESYDLFACCGILFNHESPIRGEEFVTRKITKSVARIKLGLQKTIELGNLKSSRDWGFAGDYIEAMWLMLQNKQPRDYVIATGKTNTIEDLLKISFEIIGINNWEDYVIQNPKYLRPAEVDYLKGDASKAKRELNWKPKLNFADLINLMVEEDLKRETKN